MLLEEGEERILNLLSVVFRARRGTDLTGQLRIVLSRQHRTEGDIITNVDRFSDVKRGVQGASGVKVETDRCDFLEEKRIRFS